MDSSSTIFFYDSDSDVSTQPEETLNIIDITKRAKRLYHLTDRIQYRKIWKKFANKIRLKAQIRIANKLFKLNFGFEILNIRYKSKYYHRWKRRTIFVSMLHKILFKYRMSNIHSIDNELSLEYIEEYKEKWQKWANTILINTRQMHLAEFFHRHSLFKQFFYLWLSQFETRQITNNELKNKWITLTQDLLYQNMIFTAYQLKWQFISHKLVMKNMSDFYNEEKMRNKWIQFLHQYYFHNLKENLTRNQTRFNLRNRWIQMTKKYQIKFLFIQSFRSKLPSFLSEYIRLRRQNKLQEMNQKLISTKELYANKVICKKCFANWYNTMIISKKVNYLYNKALNSSCSQFMFKAANDAAKTIQKLCRFHLNKMNFKKQLKKWKLFEYWHFKTCYYKKMYPKIKVPSLMMEIELEDLCFDKFPFVFSSNFINKIDFVKDVFDYRKTKEISRAGFVPLNKVQGFDISRSINSLMYQSHLSLSFLFTNNNEDDVIRPAYRPNNTKFIDRVTSRIGEKFDFRLPLLYISKSSHQPTVSSNEKEEISIPNISLRHTITSKKRFRFRLLLSYQDVSVLSNFSKFGGFNDYIQRKTSSLIDYNLLDENMPSSSDLLFQKAKFNLFELKAKNIPKLDLPPNFSIDFNNELNLNIYQFKKNKRSKKNIVNLFEFNKIQFNTEICSSFSKRVKENSSNCAEEIAQKFVKSDFTVIKNMNSINPFATYKSVKIPVIENVAVPISTFKKFKIISVPKEIVAENNQPNLERFSSLKEKIDFSVQRRMSRIENISKRVIDLRYSSLLNYDFAKFENNISNRISEYQLPFKNTNNIDKIVPQFDLTKPILFLSNDVSNSIPDHYQLNEKIMPHVPDSVIDEISDEIEENIKNEYPSIFNTFIFNFEKIVVKHRLYSKFKISFDDELDFRNNHQLLNVFPNIIIRKLNSIYKKEIPDLKFHFLFMLSLKSFPVHIRLSSINSFNSIQKTNKLFSRRSKSKDLPQSLLPFEIQSIKLKLPNFLTKNQGNKINHLDQINNLHHKINLDAIIDKTNFEIEKEIISQTNYHSLNDQTNLKPLNSIHIKEIPSQKIDFLLEFNFLSFPVSTQSQICAIKNFLSIQMPNKLFSKRRKTINFPQSLLPFKTRAIKLKFPDSISKNQENKINPLNQINNLRHKIDSILFVNEIDFDLKNKMCLQNNPYLNNDQINFNSRSLKAIHLKEIPSQKIDFIFSLCFQSFPVSIQSLVCSINNFIPIQKTNRLFSKQDKSIDIPRSFLPLHFQAIQLKLPNLINKENDINCLNQINNLHHKVCSNLIFNEIDFELDKEFKHESKDFSFKDFIERSNESKINSFSQIINFRYEINLDKMIDKIDFKPNVDFNIQDNNYLLNDLININVRPLNAIKRKQIPSQEIDLKLPFNFQIILPQNKQLFNSNSVQNPDILFSEQKKSTDLSFLHLPTEKLKIKLELPHFVSNNRQNKVISLHQINNNHRKICSKLNINEIDFEFDSQINQPLFNTEINIDLKFLHSIHGSKIPSPKADITYPFSFQIILPQKQLSSNTIDHFNFTHKPNKLLANNEKSIEIPHSLLPPEKLSIKLKLPDFIFKSRKNKIDPLHRINKDKIDENSKLPIDEIDFYIEKELNLQNSNSLFDEEINIDIDVGPVNTVNKSQSQFNFQNIHHSTQLHINRIFNFNPIQNLNLSFSSHDKLNNFSDSLLAPEILDVKLKIPDFISKRPKKKINPLLQINDLQDENSSNIAKDEFEFKIDKEFKLSSESSIFNDFINIYFQNKNQFHPSNKLYTFKSSIDDKYNQIQEDEALFVGREIFSQKENIISTKPISVNESNYSKSMNLLKSVDNAFSKVQFLFHVLENYTSSSITCDHKEIPKIKSMESSFDLDLIENKNIVNYNMDKIYNLSSRTKAIEKISLLKISHSISESISRNLNRTQKNIFDSLFDQFDLRSSTIGSEFDVVNSVESFMNLFSNDLNSNFHQFLSHSVSSSKFDLLYGNPEIQSNSVFNAISSFSDDLNNSLQLSLTKSFTDSLQSMDFTIINYPPVIDIDNISNEISVELTFEDLLFMNSPKQEINFINQFNDNHFQMNRALKSANREVPDQYEHRLQFPSTNEMAASLSDVSINLLYNLSYYEYRVETRNELIKLTRKSSKSLIDDLSFIFVGRFVSALTNTLNNQPCIPDLIQLKYEPIQDLEEDKIEKEKLLIGHETRTENADKNEPYFLPNEIIDEYISADILSAITFQIYSSFIPSFFPSNYLILEESFMNLFSNDLNSNFHQFLSHSVSSSKFDLLYRNPEIQSNSVFDAISSFSDNLNNSLQLSLTKSFTNSLQSIDFTIINHPPVIDINNISNEISVELTFEDLLFMNSPKQEINFINQFNDNHFNITHTSKFSDREISDQYEHQLQFPSTNEMAASLSGVSISSLYNFLYYGYRVETRNELIKLTRKSSKSLIDDLSFIFVGRFVSTLTNTLNNHPSIPDLIQLKYEPVQDLEETEQETRTEKADQNEPYFLPNEIVDECITADIQSTITLQICSSFIPSFFPSNYLILEEFEKEKKRIRALNLKLSRDKRILRPESRINTCIRHVAEQSIIQLLNDTYLQSLSLNINLMQPEINSELDEENKELGINSTIIQDESYSEEEATDEDDDEEGLFETVEEEDEYDKNIDIFEEEEDEYQRIEEEDEYDKNIDILEEEDEYEKMAYELNEEETEEEEEEEEYDKNEVTEYNDYEEEQFQENQQNSEIFDDKSIVEQSTELLALDLSQVFYNQLSIDLNEIIANRVKNIDIIPYIIEITNLEPENQVTDYFPNLNIINTSDKEYSNSKNEFYDDDKVQLDEYNDLSENEEIVFRHYSYENIHKISFNEEESKVEQIEDERESHNERQQKVESYENNLIEQSSKLLTSDLTHKFDIELLNVLNNVINSKISSIDIEQNNHSLEEENYTDEEINEMFSKEFILDEILHDPFCYVNPSFNFYHNTILLNEYEPTKIPKLFISEYYIEREKASLLEEELISCDNINVVNNITGNLFNKINNIQYKFIPNAKLDQKFEIEIDDEIKFDELFIKEKDNIEHRINIIKSNKEENNEINEKQIKTTISKNYIIRNTEISKIQFNIEHKPMKNIENYKSNELKQIYERNIPTKFEHRFQFPSTNECTVNLSDISINLLNSLQIYEYRIETRNDNYKLIRQSSKSLAEDLSYIFIGRIIYTLSDTLHNQTQFPDLIQLKYEQNTEQPLILTNKNESINIEYQAKQIENDDYEEESTENQQKTQELEDFNNNKEDEFDQNEVTQNQEDNKVNNQPKDKNDYDSYEESNEENEINKDEEEETENQDKKKSEEKLKEATEYESYDESNNKTSEYEEDELDKDSSSENNEKYLNDEIETIINRDFILNELIQNPFVLSKSSLFFEPTNNVLKSYESTKSTINENELRNKKYFIENDFQIYDKDNKDLNDNQFNSIFDNNIKFSFNKINNIQYKIIPNSKLDQNFHIKIDEEIKFDELFTNEKENINHQLRNIENYKSNEIKQIYERNIPSKFEHRFQFPSTNECTVNLSDISINLLNSLQIYEYRIETRNDNYKLIRQSSKSLIEDLSYIFIGRIIYTLSDTLHNQTQIPDLIQLKYEQNTEQQSKQESKSAILLNLNRSEDFEHEMETNNFQRNQINVNENDESSSENRNKEKIKTQEATDNDSYEESVDEEEEEKVDKDYDEDEKKKKDKSKEATKYDSYDESNDKASEYEEDELDEDSSSENEEKYLILNDLHIYDDDTNGLDDNFISIFNNNIKLSFDKINNIQYKFIPNAKLDQKFEIEIDDEIKFDELFIKEKENIEHRINIIKSNKEETNEINEKQIKTTISTNYIIRNTEISKIQFNIEHKPIINIENYKSKELKQIYERNIPTKFEHRFQFPSTNECTVNLSDISVNLLNSLQIYEYRIETRTEEHKLIRQSSKSLAEDLSYIFIGRFIYTLSDTLHNQTQIPDLIQLKYEKEVLKSENKSQSLNTKEIEKEKEKGGDDDVEYEEESEYEEDESDKDEETDGKFNAESKEETDYDSYDESKDEVTENKANAQSKEDDGEEYDESTEEEEFDVEEEKENQDEKKKNDKSEHSTDYDSYNESDDDDENKYEMDESDSDD